MNVMALNNHRHIWFESTSCNAGGSWGPCSHRVPTRLSILIIILCRIAESKPPCPWPTERDRRDLQCDTRHEIGMARVNRINCQYIHTYSSRRNLRGTWKWFTTSHISGIHNCFWSNFTRYRNTYKHSASAKLQVLIAAFTPFSHMICWMGWKRRLINWTCNAPH